MHRPAPPSDCPERLTTKRIVAADVNAQRTSSATSAAVLEDTLGLPGGQLANLLGERLCVARKLECFNCQDRRRRMVAVAAPLRGEPRNHHVGPEGANHAHDVGHDGVSIPNSKRLRGALRKAEVDCAGEKLPAAVNAAGGKEFLGTDDAQFFEEFRTNHVLATVAPREREVGRAVAAAAGEVS